jgi:16S rRNA (cytosine1402-N4)-methyltransferase
MMQKRILNGLPHLTLEPVDMPPIHRPVLYKEIIHALRPKSEGRYVDGTLGAGGHAFGLLEASSPGGLILGLDVDPQALEVAHRILAPFGERIYIKRASYTTLAAQLSDLGWQSVDGILLDLGASSMQFDTPERGFSFLQDGPLDMRFDQTSPLDAGQIVNDWSEGELANIIFQYGEEQSSRRIARAIVTARPIQSTRHLADIIEHAVRRQDSHHPATRTFQALRIMVNSELEAVKQVLPMAMQVLNSGGRLAVISFHSLEDRLVKEYFRQESRDCLCPPKQPVCTCGHKATLFEINRRPITPTTEEIEGNKRSRSAKLRIAERR